jgi:hypothetical protein
MLFAVLGGSLVALAVLGPLVPFTFVPGRTDTSDFRTLTRPARTMSGREEWIYNQLAVDWAELDAFTQKQLYAQACIGKLTTHVQAVFETATTEISADLDRASHKYGERPGAVPKRDYVVGSADLPLIMGYFNKALLDSTASSLLRLKEAADHELGRIATRSLDPPSAAELAPPVRRGFWQRVLEGP